MKIIIAVLSLYLITNADISMQGIKIGNPETALTKVKLEVEAQERGMVKYRTQNGNALSITCENGKVVYMENDWLQDPKGQQPLFSNFQFGVTSLKAIRERFQTNGFTYSSRTSFKTATHLIQFNCFEFDSANHEVLVAITKVSLASDGVTEANVAEHLKLDALIIADKSYLDSTWKGEILSDKNYKKIKME